jgi:hypothetical protein
VCLNELEISTSESRERKEADAEVREVRLQPCDS